MLHLLESRLREEHEKRCLELRTEFERALAAARQEFNTALADMEGRLSVEDCRLLAALVDKQATAAPGAKNAPARTAGLEEILACCDYPGTTRTKTASKTLTVLGWALARSGVRAVDTFVDDRPYGHCAYGALRSDVGINHPEYPESEHCGYVGTVFVSGLEEGPHQLTVRITAENGKQQRLNCTFEVKKSTTGTGELPNTHAEYQAWLAHHATRPGDLAAAAADVALYALRPKISLVVPVYNTPAALLEAMIDSVRAQVYDNWDLCLANDASTAEHIGPLLARLAAEEPRVKVVSLPENRGISVASNAALALATGDFVGLLDSDDLLAPLALYEVVRLLNEQPDTDLIYTDEDKVTETGRFRFDPFFKPDWSPDLLFSGNYINHFGVYRRALLEEIGGFRPEFEGSQDYDLVLRFTERTSRIRHIPKVLYTWRVLAGSGASTETAKPHTLDAARRALAAALERRHLPGQVEPGLATGRWRVRYDLAEQADVTLLIPTGGKLQYLEPCLESVLSRSSYPHFEILVIDNSEGTEVAALCARLREEHPNLQCRSFGLKPFNYSALNNYGMRFVKTPYVVFLNDDITVIAPDWIDAMLEHAQRPEVGVVGAKLLFPNDNIQHAGVILGPHENSAHAFKHFPADDPGYYYFPKIIRNYSAVTFACAMMRVSVYQEVGGLDEINLPVAFNDVDLCLRVRARGYWVVYTPYALLYHHESVTKKLMVVPGEVEHMKKCWGDVIEHDPFYNPNLTREGEDYALNLE